MAHEEMDRTDRRKFLQAGALATASAVSMSSRRDRAGAGRQVTGLTQAKAR